MKTYDMNIGMLEMDDLDLCYYFFATHDHEITKLTCHVSNVLRLYYDKIL